MAGLSCGDQSRTIIQALENKILELGIALPPTVKWICHQARNVFIVKSAEKKTWTADKLIVTTVANPTPSTWLYQLWTESTRTFKQPCTRSKESGESPLLADFPTRYQGISLTNVSPQLINIITHDPSLTHFGLFLAYRPFGCQLC